MKGPFALILIPALFLHTFPLKAQRKQDPDSVKVSLKLGKKSKAQIPVDSAFIIFDKYNLNGAGIVYKVYRVSSDHIELENVPVGKYYIDVFCYGPARQRLTKTVYLSSRRKINKIRFKPKSTELYAPGEAFIPPEKISPTRLKVTHEGSFRP